MALTGYGQLENRQCTAAASFNAHVTKPAAVDELVGILSQPSP